MFYGAGRNAAGPSGQHIRMLLSIWSRTPSRLGAQHLAFQRFRLLSTGRLICSQKRPEAPQVQVQPHKPLDATLQCPRRWSHSKPQARSTLRERLSKFWQLSAKGEEDKSKSASFAKMIALAKPESKPIGIAIGMLLVSSSVSMSVPFTIGKLIDYFSTSNPVRVYTSYTTWTNLTHVFHSKSRWACRPSKLL